MTLPSACLLSAASAPRSISTGKERDAESGNDYFGARYYGSSMGRWMSPDPYGGSYDFANPQSFNRYSYVLNNPLSAIDPAGLYTNGASAPADSGCGAECGVFDLITAGIAELISLFSHPSFRGSLKPRPNAQPWDEYNIHYGPNIAGALGLPDAGCEFGACGNPGAMNATNGAQNQGSIPSNSAYTFSAFGAILPLVVVVDGVPIPVASLGVSPSLTVIPKTRTVCAGFALGVATGTGKSLSFTAYPSRSAAYSKAVTSSWGWNLGAQPSPFGGVSVNTNSSGTLFGYTLATDPGISASYGYTWCGDF